MKLYKLTSLRSLAENENLPFILCKRETKDVEYYDSFSGEVLGSFRDEPVGYVVLENATVTDCGCIIYKNNLIVEGIKHVPYNWQDVDLSNTLNSNTFQQVGDFISINHNKDIIYVEDDYVNLSSVIPQVGHLMLDTLPQHYVYEKIPCNKIVMKHPTMCSMPMVNYLINFFFSHTDKMYYSDNWITFKKLYVIETGMRDTIYSNFCIDRYGVESYKKKIDVIVQKNQDRDYSQNIFIDRGDANNIDGRSNITNREELYNLLQKYDYKIINVSKIPVDEQIKTFANAKNICGVHGAGITNCIFQKKGSNVIEIEYHSNRVHGRILPSYDLNWYVCKSTITTNENKSESMVIDLESLEKIFTLLK